MNAPNLGYLSRHQGPRPRADATSEPHGRPPPPCTELDHGELLTLYPLLRRAHPASSSSTAPDVREEEASRCGRKEGAREWSAVRRDPSRAGRELHCSSTGADHCLPCPSALKEDPATAALASNSTPLPPGTGPARGCITTDGVNSLPPVCSALNLLSVCISKIRSSILDPPH